MRSLPLLLLLLPVLALAHPPKINPKLLLADGELAFLGTTPGGPASVTEFEQALSYLAQQDSAAAQESLKQLLLQYPATPAAAAGRRLLPIIGASKPPSSIPLSLIPLAALLGCAVGLALAKALEKRTAPSQH